MRIKLLIVSLLIIVMSCFHLSFAKPIGRQYCDQEGFSCIKIKRNQSWHSLWPNEEERDIVMRINHMNTRLYPGLIIAVPDNLESANIMDFSPFPHEITPPNEKVLIFDPKYQAWGAYDANGMLVRWGPAAGGGKWCADIRRSCLTKAGQFRVYSMGSSKCVSSKFPIPRGGAPMPYCMFFNHGQALHGSPNGLVGLNSSHGCVRLYVSDAEWLRYDFIEGPSAYNQYRGTKVIVRPTP